MKKYSIRVIAILCILAAVCLTLFPAWFQLSGVKRKQLKTLREDVDSFATSVSEAYSKDKSAYLDACEDIDLELSRKEIKQWVSRLKEVGNIAYAGKLSLMNVTKAGLLLGDAVKLLEEPIEDNGSRKVLKVISGNGWIISTTEAAQIDEAAEDGLGDYLRLPGTVMLILVIVLCALALAALALTWFNKGGAARWILFALVLLLAAASIAGTTVLNGLDLELPEGYENAKLTCTVWPYLSAVLSLAGAILPCFSKETDKEKAKVNLTKTLIIAGSVVLALGLAGMVVFVGVPFIRYQKAEALYDQEDYEGARESYEALGDYMDSVSKATKSVYQQAKQAQEAGEYEQAIAIYESLGDYKDSQEKITVCQTALKDIAYEEAVALKEAGKYEEAIAAFKAMGGYKDSADLLTESKYLHAVALKDAGQYEKAIAALETLSGYKDSADILTESKYHYAVVLKDAGQYEEAKSAFEKIADYKDSAEQAELCENEIAYAEAVALKDAGKYEDAISAFKVLSGYRDSAEQIEQCYIGKYGAEKWQIVKNMIDADVGDAVIFGSYEQDNDTTNGAEEIEWRVLAKEGNKILVISENGLDCQRYNTEYTNITWETSTLRTWLNGTFLDAAFSAEEQGMIQTTQVTADRNPNYSTNPGNDTTDKVFLLSITEAGKYNTTNEDRKCVPTVYATAQSASTSSKYTKGGAATCRWWLRSPGYGQFAAAFVDYDGSVNDTGDFVHGNDDDCVRPAMWIDLG